MNKYLTKIMKSISLNASEVITKISVLHCSDEPYKSQPPMAPFCLYILGHEKFQATITHLLPSSLLLDLSISQRL